MILVDTSVWIDHLRKPDARLLELLRKDEILIHPLVRLELALGSIANRETFLAQLAKLLRPPVADEEEIFHLLESKRLYRRGIGVTDLHLVASALLGPSIQIWTKDRRLGEIAEELGIRAVL
ncbi:MAG TPA: PIN domain-containing protein [Acidobacteriaceae bacterium]|nr:PIN domain-containing protein [Acidobacteriaceae bacterium]